MPANRCFTIGAGPFAAMGRSYKSPGTAWERTRAREPPCPVKARPHPITDTRPHASPDRHAGD